MAPGNATITSRTQPPTPRGREKGQKLTREKQMHEKHIDQPSLPQTRWSQCLTKINMSYQYPYIRNHKSIKQGYIESSKMKHESPKLEDDLNPRNPRIRQGVRENVSILCHTSITPMLPFRFVKIYVSHDRSGKSPFNMSYKVCDWNGVTGNKLIVSFIELYDGGHESRF